MGKFATVVHLAKGDAQSVSEAALHFCCTALSPLCIFLLFMNVSPDFGCGYHVAQSLIYVDFFYRWNYGRPFWVGNTMLMKN